MMSLAIRLLSRSPIPHHTVAPHGSKDLPIVIRRLESPRGPDQELQVRKSSLSAIAERGQRVAGDPFEGLRAAVFRSRARSGAAATGGR